MNFSILIPVYNEEDNILFLYNELVSIMSAFSYGYEIIYVDDKSTDNTRSSIQNLIEENNNIYLVEHKKRMGQSSALLSGINYSRYENLIVLDGDGQDNPIYLNDMIKIYLSGYDMVRAVRKNRADSGFKKIQSNLGNGLIKKVIDHPLDDLGCAMKLFKKKLALDIRFKYNFHRYVALFFYKKKYKIRSIQVESRVRQAGLSKYGLKRAIYLFRDLFFLKLYFIGESSQE